MPTDLARILENLTAFYTFAGRSVIHVGAGGGQLIGYARVCRRVLAVDPDAAAVARLREALETQGLDAIVSTLEQPFESLQVAADVVLFEFCLHEMDAPELSIEHARRLAPDVLVLDHAPESPWSWYADESAAMARAWVAVAAAGMRSVASCTAVQRFDDHAQLAARFAAAGLGEEALRRIDILRGQAPIEIAMPYGIALI